MMMKMRVSLSFLLMIIVNATMITHAVATDSAKELARQAYYEIEDNVFDLEKLDKAMKKLQQAQKANPKEPWVSIAASQAALVYGYKIGDWFRMDTFEVGVVDKTLALAKKAVDLGPEESQAYAQLARIYIIKDEYRTAWELLNTAYNKDKTNYYPWYLRGIISVKMKDILKATSYFDEAEKLATHKYQQRQLNYQRQKVAKMNGDVAAEEYWLKKNIEKNPDSAHIYGNYAQFLKKHKRYDLSLIHI